MIAEFVCVPIPTSTFLALSAFLNRVGSKESPASAVELAVSYWLDNAEWKVEDLVPNRKVQKGYSWKELFLPEGTQLRMRYKGKVYDASVVSDDVVFGGKIVSPSEYANTVAGSARNAWRDIEVLFPGGQTWILADKLRK